MVQHQVYFYLMLCKSLGVSYNCVPGKGNLCSTSFILFSQKLKAKIPEFIVLVPVKIRFKHNSASKSFLTFRSTFQKS